MSPRYEDHAPVMNVCQSCGAFVGDMGIHEDWHAGMATAATHLNHARNCSCLNDSSECCRPNCACHDEALSP